MNTVDDSARAAVLAAIEEAERRFLARAETAKSEAESAGARRYAQWCHRAYVAEQADPKPMEPS